MLLQSDTSSHLVSKIFAQVYTLPFSLLLWQIVIYSTVPGIHGSKQTESEGIAQGQGFCLLTAVNPYNYYTSHLIGPVVNNHVQVFTVNTSVHVQVFTIT